MTATRMYMVHRDRRLLSRKCRLEAGCETPARWCARIEFLNGTVRTRAACFAHAVEWARARGAKPPEEDV